MRGKEKFGLVLVAFLLAAAIGLAGRSQGPASPSAAQSETAQSPEPPQRVRVSPGVIEGLMVTKVAPRYPEKARKKQIQGTVVVHAIISQDGDIVTVELVSGHPLLAPAAIEAVKQWKYRPYRLNGQAVEVDTQFRVNFTLSAN